MKKRVITIAGRPGSGKSSTAKLVAKKLGYNHFSSGDLFRSIAEQQGHDVLQANLSAEGQDDPEIDRLVDGKLQELNKTADKLVIDSRTAWHWIPESFKVFLDLDLEVAASRIIEQMEQRQDVNEAIPSSPEEYAITLRNRLESENRRYNILYGINPGDMGNYDLVIDTEKSNLEQVVEQIITEYKTLN